MMDALFWHQVGDDAEGGGGPTGGSGGTGDAPASPTAVRVAHVVRLAASAMAGMERWCVGKRLELECENEDVLPLLEEMYGTVRGNAALRRCLLEGRAGNVRDAASVCRWTLRNQAAGPRGKLRFKAALAAAVGLEDAMALLRLGHGDDDAYDPFSGLWTLGSRSVGALLAQHAWPGDATAARQAHLSPIDEVATCASGSGESCPPVQPANKGTVAQRRHQYVASGGIASRSVEYMHQQRASPSHGSDRLPALKRAEAHTTWTSPSRGPSTGTPILPPPLKPAPSAVSPHGALSPLADATRDGGPSPPATDTTATPQSQRGGKRRGVRALARAMLGRDVQEGRSPQRDVTAGATPPVAAEQVPTAGVLVPPPQPQMRRDSDADSVVVHHSLDGVGRETSMFFSSGAPLPPNTVDEVHMTDTGCGPGKLCAGAMWKRVGRRTPAANQPFPDVHHAQAAVAAAATNAGVQPLRLDEAAAPADPAAMSARARQETAATLARLQRDTPASDVAPAVHVQGSGWRTWVPWRRRRASHALPPSLVSATTGTRHGRTASAPLPASEAGVRLRSPTWTELATRRASAGDRVPEMTFESPAHELAVRQALTRANRTATPAAVSDQLHRLERHSAVRDHTAMAAANATVAYQQRPAAGECAVM